MNDPFLTAIEAAHHAAHTIRRWQDADKRREQRSDNDHLSSADRKRLQRLLDQLTSDMKAAYDARRDYGTAQRQASQFLGR